MTISEFPRLRSSNVCFLLKSLGIPNLHVGVFARIYVLVCRPCVMLASQNFTNNIPRENPENRSAPNMRWIKTCGRPLQRPLKYSNRAKD